MGYQLIQLSVQGMDDWVREDTPLDSLRTDEKGIEGATGEDGFVYTAIYD